MTVHNHDRRSFETNRQFVLDLHGAYIAGTSLSDGSLRNANFAGTNATRVNFSGSDFAGANLKGTILKGADLSHARNLTIEQLREAVIDDETVLPDYIDRAALRNG